MGYRGGCSRCLIVFVSVPPAGRRCGVGRHTRREHGDRVCCFAGAGVFLRFKTGMILAFLRGENWSGVERKDHHRYTSSQHKLPIKCKAVAAGRRDMLNGLVVF